MGRSGSMCFSFLEEGDARNRSSHRPGLCIGRSLTESSAPPSRSSQRRQTFDRGVVIGEEDVIDEPHGKRGFPDATG